MDVFAHVLYANLVFKDLPIEKRSIALVFSVAPDFLSFSLLTFRMMINKNLRLAKPDLKHIPPYVHRLYDITHSLVVWLAVFLLLWFFAPKWLAIAFMAWGMHILIDIFTHTEEFFPTPLFWPISKFHFSILSWSETWFQIANYSLIAILYWLFYF